MSSSSLRVVIADDDPLARNALAHHLTQAGVTVVAQVSDGDAAVHAVRTHEPDLLISDMWMRNVNGVKAAAAAKRAQPGLRVLLMSRDVPSELIVAARMAGADGVIKKEDLAHSLADVLFGAGRPARASQDGQAPVALSERERQIAARIVRGQTNTEIAAELGLSPNSVKTYVSRLYSKFGIVNRVQLVRALDQRAVSY